MRHGSIIRVGGLGRPPKTAELVNWFTLFPPRPCLPDGDESLAGATEMTSLHGEYSIESFEAGRGLWHARIRRADEKPLIVNGSAFPHLEVGFAWTDRTAAIEDARTYIDRFGPRWAARSETSGIQPVTIA